MVSPRFPPGGELRGGPGQAGGGAGGARGLQDLPRSSGRRIDFAMGKTLGVAGLGELPSGNLTIHRKTMKTIGKL